MCLHAPHHEKQSTCKSESSFRRRCGGQILVIPVGVGVIPAHPRRQAPDDRPPERIVRRGCHAPLEQPANEQLVVDRREACLRPSSSPRDGIEGGPGERECVACVDSIAIEQ